MPGSASLPEYSFRTSSDKSLPSHRIRLMRASPRMDLLLLAADNGDVLLFRWGWERVWLASRPRDLPQQTAATVDADSAAGEDDLSLPVTCIDWRPDGQVALVAYSDGRLRHLSLEDGSLLHEDWLTRPEDRQTDDDPVDEGPALCSHWALLANRQFNEPWTRASEALPVFADLLGAGSDGGGSSAGSSASGVVDWTASRRIERQLSLLALVSRRRVHLLAYGVCRLCRVSLDQLSCGAWPPGHFRPVSVLLSDSLASVSVLANRTCPGGGPPAVLQFDTGLAAAGRCERVRRVSLTVVQLTQLAGAVRRCLKEMSECWEDSVHELDQKFTDYSKDRDEYALAMGEPDWQLRTDLMALLLTGHCHAKFREFLCEGLSKTGLIRIGRGIEASLCAVQRHNARQLQTLLFALIFHLAELADCAATGVGDLGPSRGREDNDDDDGESGDDGEEDDLGDGRLEAEASDDEETQNDGKKRGSGDTRLGDLSRRRATDALSYAGSALAKSLELGSVIERTRDSLRAFCEWLYVQILRLSKEAVPRALQRSTVQRRRLVIDFIRHQLAEGAGQRRFRLELVGQYLAEAPLAAMPDCPTVWQQVLERHLQREASSSSEQPWWPSQSRRQRRLLQSCALVRPDREASLAQCLARLCDRVAAACRLVEPRQLKLPMAPPVQPLAGVRPLAQGHMGKQALYHAILLHSDGSTGLLVRQAPSGAGWCGLRFRCSAGDATAGAFDLVDACQLDAGQFVCLLSGPGHAAASSLIVLPLAAFNEADWSTTPLASAEAAVGPDSPIIDLADRLGERLRANNLPGRGVAVAAERRLMVSVLFACQRRLRVCLLEPYSEDEDDDEEGAEAGAEGDVDDEDRVANASTMSAALMEQD